MTCIPYETGEIYIGGRCLTDGYADSYNLTVNCYILNPFGEGRIYRSGDLGYMRADGEIIYVGRNDDQIKLNGQRVEPEEVAGAMLSSGVLLDAYCLAGRRPSGGAQLIAFYVPDTAYEAGPMVLEHLRKTLPSYMIPNVLISIDEMPRTVTSKIDRKALLGIYEEYVAGLSVDDDVDERLLDIWKEVLGVAGVDGNLSFFSQGGTSIDALVCVMRYFEMSFDFKLADFYHSRTLREQSEILRSGRLNKPAFTYEYTEGVERLIYVPDETGSIFLTGAAEFLGVHLLRELVSIYPDRKIYAMVRSKDLKAVYMDMFGEVLPDTVHEIDGDISVESLGLSAEMYAELLGEVTGVINCAADVRHYVTDEAAMERVNAGGVDNLIDFCLKADAELVQISTASLSHAPDLGNVYLRTKMMAEDHMRSKRGLKYRIYRVGRLAGRMSDGRFQEHPETNAFYLLISAIAEAGFVPASMESMKIEITPVDWAARRLAPAIHMCEDDSDICHPYLYSISEIADALGIPLTIIPDDSFESSLRNKTNKNNRLSLSFFADYYHQFKESVSMDAPVSTGEPVDLGVVLKEFKNEQICNRTI